MIPLQTCLTTLIYCALSLAISSFAFTAVGSFFVAPFHCVLRRPLFHLLALADIAIVSIACCFSFCVALGPHVQNPQQDGTGFDFELSSLVFTLLSLIGLYCSSRYCICFNSMLVCIFCITLKPCILESSLLFVSQLSTERDEFENDLKKLKDSRNRQLDENDELRRIKAENTALHRKLQGSAFTIDLVVLAFCIFHRSYIK